MDSIGIHISRRLGPDGRVEVKMKETGRAIRLQPIDAREAIESRRGVLIGAPATSVPDLRKITPEMTEDEIVEQLEQPRTAPDPRPTSHPSMRPQSSRAAQPARAGTRAAQPQQFLPPPPPPPAYVEPAHVEPAFVSPTTPPPGQAGAGD